MPFAKWVVYATDLLPQIRCPCAVQCGPAWSSCYLVSTKCSGGLAVPVNDILWSTPKRQKQKCRALVCRCRVQHSQVAVQRTTGPPSHFSTPVGGCSVSVGCKISASHGMSELGLKDDLIPWNIDNKLPECAKSERMTLRPPAHRRKQPNQPTSPVTKLHKTANRWRRLRHSPRRRAMFTSEQGSRRRSHISTSHTLWYTCVN